MESCTPLEPPQNDPPTEVSLTPSSSVYEVEPSSKFRSDANDVSDMLLAPSIGVH